MFLYYHWKCVVWVKTMFAKLKLHINDRVARQSAANYCKLDYHLGLKYIKLSN